MSGTTTSDRLNLLTRSKVWSDTLKMILEDELFAQGFVDWIQGEFPDGDNFTIPSMGQAQVDDYQEDSPITYRPLDTGEWVFNIDQYKASGISITKKALQDNYYLKAWESEFMPRMEYALMSDIEARILNLQGKQDLGDNNTINGFHHRYIGSGDAGGQKMGLEDIAYAKLALKKAHVPMTNLIGIVDPTFAYHLESQATIVDGAYNPQWQSISMDGITTGMRFIRNIFGFDLYESNFLATVDETVDQKDGETEKTVTGGKANLFFSAAPGVQPIKGAFRQLPEFDTEYDMNHQRYNIALTARYGVDLFRPENFVVVLGEEWA